MEARDAGRRVGRLGRGGRDPWPAGAQAKEVEDEAGLSDSFRYAHLSDALAALSAALGDARTLETVGTPDAFGRVLAKDVLAPRDLPEKDVASFDGYAIASSATEGAAPGSPVELELLPGETKAGQVQKGRLSEGQAARVATGAYLPRGADAVVAKEDVAAAEEAVSIPKAVARGEHVFRRGADVMRGERVLAAGRRVLGQDLVLLASLHIARVPVFREPRVAILPTGSELTSEIGDRREGKVVESHSLMLRRLVEGAGGRAETRPIVRDDREALVRSIRAALAKSDILFTLAGSSVGEPDLVESALRRAGATMLIHGVRVHRGRVMGVSMVSGKPVVILPGPVQGALNAFIVFGYPIIRHHLGRGLEAPPWLPATVSEDWEATGKFRDFHQVVYLALRRDPGGGALLAAPSGAETEKASFLASKNAYVLVPGPGGRLSKGQSIQARFLPGFSGVE